nr:OB-fold domain-containing protein [Micromonospora sp. DSM 115978]
SLPRCDAGRIGGEPECGRFAWYPAPACRWCSGRSFAWVELSGQAVVFAWTKVVHPFLPQYASLVPYLTALVTPVEAPYVRLVTRLVDFGDTEPEIGMPVRATFRPLAFDGVPTTVVAPLFRPV